MIVFFYFLGKIFLKFLLVRLAAINHFSFRLFLIIIRCSLFLFSRAAWVCLRLVEICFSNLLILLFELAETEDKALFLYNLFLQATLFGVLFTFISEWVESYSCWRWRIFPILLLELNFFIKTSTNESYIKYKVYNHYLMLPIINL